MISHNMTISSEIRSVAVEICQRSELVEFVSGFGNFSTNDTEKSTRPLDTEHNIFKYLGKL